MENKTGKPAYRTGRYIKYATGEIVLVVIGILIALQINNWNERRKSENKVVAILKEVQHDLGIDIQKSDELIAYYKTQDSIIRLVMTDQLTVEDYSDSNYLLRYVILNAFHMKIHSNGYAKLIENVDNVPPSFKEIIDPLNQIYVYNKYEIDKFDDRLDKITDRLFDELASTKDWFYKLAEPQLTDEMITYFRTDPKYKNAAFIYQTAAWTNLSFHVQEFRRNAITSYIKINELLGSNEPLPDFIPHHKVDITQEQLQEYAGVYKRVSIENFYGDLNDVPYKFWIHKNQLVGARLADLENFVFYYFEATDIATNNDIYNKVEFIRDSSGQIKGALYKVMTGDTEHYIKLKE